MFRALKTWLKNVVAVHPADGKEPETMSERGTYVHLGSRWESYARINDPRLLQELNQLAQKGESRYQDTFIYAVALGHLELAVTLLEYDVTVNTETLICSVINGHMEMTRLLLAHGADVSTVQPASISQGFNYYPPGPFTTDMTPLMAAVSIGNAEIVQILLDAGALLNTQNKQGQTALAFVWSSGHREVTRLLIEAGIDIKDKDITALLGRPLKEVHPDIIELLQTAGCQ